jgi:hypothetical protein
MADIEIEVIDPVNELADGGQACLRDPAVSFIA